MSEHKFSLWTHKGRGGVAQQGGANPPLKLLVTEGQAGFCCQCERLMARLEVSEPFGTGVRCRAECGFGETALASNSGL